MKLFLSTVLLALGSDVHAFTPATVVSGARRATMAVPQQSSWLQAATTEELEAVSSMRAGEIKKELESYGISTAAFLEKSELVDALVDARAKGLKPRESTATTASTDTSTENESTGRSSSTTSSSSTDSRPREVRLKEEMENLKSMKASEMKKELEERGVSTASFFEKSEFLKALAEARVDGVRNTDGKKKKKRRGGSNDESYAEYADVEVITDDSAGPRQKQPDSSRGAGSSPFGGGGGSSPFGGANMQDMMGGMGGIADLLKNMGGMGGASAGATGSPFGGMGGMGGVGDMMGKAQEMMKNPKVMEIMMKAQKNPKIMAAMQDCMSNPAAFAKYRNDPEMSEMIRELEKCM